MEIADAEAITLWGVWAQVPVAYNPELVEGIEVRFFYPGVMKYENVRLK